MFRRTIPLLLALSFTLGIHQGQLALWRDKEPEPLVCYPLSADLLPENIRQMLAAGITVEDKDQLHRLLEDLLS